MATISNHKEEISSGGYTVIDNIYTDHEVAQIINIIEKADTSGRTFRKTTELFAIRQFLKTVPETVEWIFNEKLWFVISSVLGNDYFVIKSIYFDKPQASNWYVSYHQDLTISVDQKAALEGYTSWTVKQDQFAVQPPLEILDNIYTVRIHLDDTDENNGALKIIPQSHTRGIYRTEMINLNEEKEIICDVPKGGIMIMKPLLLHSSGRTTSKRQRRVIHIEFSSMQLPAGIEWSERNI